MLNNNIKAGIFGIAGKELQPEEQAFFNQLNPLGFILFARNIENKEQVKKLTTDLRKTIARSNAPILIDQEGGRVQRLRPPIWREAPPADVFGNLFTQKGQEKAINALQLNIHLLAQELIEIGINVDCLPVLDVPIENAHDVIGNRAFSKNPEINTILGRVVIDELLANGVFPIVKHIPGHGRAFVDSHEKLPIVDSDVDELEKTDFLPFKELADAPWGMTAHVVFSQIDNKNPATTSAVVINEVIRSYMGFSGFLISDDLSMKALGGSYAERCEKSLLAGCDAILHCNGKMEEMKEIATVLPNLSANAELRLLKAEKIMATFPKKQLTASALERLEALLV